MYIHAFDSAIRNNDRRNSVCMGIIMESALAEYGDYVCSRERLLTINYGIFLTVERIAIFSDVGNRPGYNSFDKF